jgi:hypothetical protein
MVAIGLVLVAACASTSSDSVAPGPSTTGPTPVTTDALAAMPGSTDGPTTVTTITGRDPAPDFTLQLGEGGSYTLSEGESPVYLVFWAEW